MSSDKKPKTHAAVAPSTFPSQNVQKLKGSDRFWKLEVSKMARACGACTFPSQKVKKTYSLRRFLEVGSLKNGTRVWRKARFQVKMLKH